MYRDDWQSLFPMIYLLNFHRDHMSTLFLMMKYTYDEVNIEIHIMKWWSKHRIDTLTLFIYSETWKQRPIEMLHWRFSYKFTVKPGNEDPWKRRPLAYKDKENSFVYHVKITWKWRPSAYKDCFKGGGCLRFPSFTILI